MNSDVKNHPFFKDDEVLQEVWRIKDELSAKRGHDIHRLFEDLRKLEADFAAPKNGGERVNADKK